MTSGSVRRVCIVPRVSGVGGMVSFRHKFAAGLARRGVEVCDDLRDQPYDAVLVIGGTRDIAGLRRVRKRRIPIVQRLNGMNWLHRLPPGPRRPRLSLRHKLRAEIGNFILAFIRRRLASQIIYQSQFTRAWWERVYGATDARNTVIHNGVDLDQYSPHGDERPPEDLYRILMVEGSLAGGYEQGLTVAFELLGRMGTEYRQYLPLELMVVGRVSAQLQAHWQARLVELIAEMDEPADLRVNWAGQVPRGQIPRIDRAAHIFYSSDINPACPNAVIEALACGLPVISFDTGALPELVTDEAGRIAPYGGDPWRLDPPDIAGLAQAASSVLGNLDSFRQGARARALDAFGLQTMVDAYLQVLSGG